MEHNSNISPYENLENIIIKSLNDSKAENILTIDLTNKTNFAKSMIIADGLANRHVEAIANRLSQDLKDNNIFDIHVEGRKQANWILIDIGDIIVNIFQPETRQFYDLESLWSNIDIS